MYNVLGTIQSLRTNTQHYVTACSNSIYVYGCTYTIHFATGIVIKREIYVMYYRCNVKPTIIKKKLYMPSLSVLKL